MQRIERLLQLHFAALTAIGGLLLSSGEVGIILPAIAVVAAVVSYLIVDRFQIFALPTSLAYVGMGIVAAYCMIEFMFTRTTNQLMVVAQLLVLVEVVLLFQKKNVRVFEQIGVFCLLELIVAAVFNSALMFGLLLIPFALLGLRALVLLQAMITMNALGEREQGGIKTSANDACQLVARRSARLPRYGIAVLTPSVLMVAFFFFYGLPRAIGSGDGGRVGGRVTTGFTDSLTLDQVGELLQNRDLVMRLRLTDNTGAPYVPRDPIYLRGQALEAYRNDRGTGRWEAGPQEARLMGDLLPEQYQPPRSTTRILYDDVQVNIDLQPLTASETLFSIAPYHGRIEGVHHLAGRWVLRRHEEDVNTNSRFNYQFGTHAFSNGLQTKFIRYFSQDDRMYGQVPNVPGWQRRRLIEFDAEAMPSVVAEAEMVASTLGERVSEPYQLARAIERHLSSGERFTYTTALTEQRNRGTDPLEEFVGKYRRGHCQYFASAMVMMLRSQGVPARVVVGYRTEEFNPIGKHYIVRQLHAHSWVEVLLQDDQIPLGAGLAGQPLDGPVLARFDPTPYAAGDRDEGAGGVGHFYDFAQSLWNNYVLDMDGQRRSASLFGQDENSGMSTAYSRMILQIKLFASQLNSGELGAGALAGGSLFSWRGAALGIIVTLILFGLYQIGPPKWLRIGWQTRRARRQAASASSILFFQRFSDLLANAKLVRRSGETPAEFVELASRAAAKSEEHPLVDSAMKKLLERFYQIRYGGRQPLTSGEQTEIDQSLQAVAAWTQSEQAIAEIASLNNTSNSNT
ncbi:transglutaminase TgpA family protein [Planctomycetaceae bacterium SH139]